MSKQRLSYLKNLDSKTFVRIIDLGKYCNELQELINNNNSDIENLNNQIKILQSQMKTASRDDKSQIVTSVKSISDERKNIQQNINAILTDLNAAKTDIARLSNEDAYTTDRISFPDYIIDIVNSDESLLSRFKTEIEESPTYNLKSNYGKEIAQRILGDANAESRLQKLTTLESFCSRISEPAKKVFDADDTRNNIASFLSGNEVGGKKSRKRRTRKHKKISRKNKRHRKSRKY